MFLVIVVALMIVVDPFVAELEKRGLRRSFAIAAAFAGLFSIVGLFCAFTVPRF